MRSNQSLGPTQATACNTGGAARLNRYPSTTEEPNMAIPDYQSIMLPLLRFAADGNEHSLRESIEGLSEQFGLTDAEKNELLPSGQQPRFDNRVAWSRSYLSMAALLESTRRGYFRITQRGRDVLSKNPREINVKFLGQFPEFIEFRAKRREREETAETA